MNKDIVAVDLFCGAGGLTKGLENANIKVKAGYDTNENCEFPYSENNDASFVKKDVRELQAADIEEKFEDDKLSLIAGCAPCQPFSRMGRTKKNEKWSLLDDFRKLVEDVNPDLVTMENVPQVTNHEIFERFVNGLEDEGYKVSHQIVKCEEYGIPQSRKRLVLLASKFGEIDLPEPKDEKMTVKDAIGHLEELEAGEKSDEDQLHIAAGLSQKNLKRIRASEPGGTWESWPDDLKLDCHKKDTGSTYKSVYGRMEWEKPSPTITTQFYGYGNGRFGHPEQDRAITIREGALLQTFPEDYQFVDPEDEFHKTEIGRLIGNSVPVKLAEIIGNRIRKHVESRRDLQAAKATTI